MVSGKTLDERDYRIINLTNKRPTTSFKKGKGNHQLSCEVCPRCMGKGEGSTKTEPRVTLVLKHLNMERENPQDDAALS